MNDIHGLLTNTTSSSVTATYIVTPLSGICTGTAFTVSVYINPTATVTSMSTSTCSGVAFTATPADVTNGIIPAGTLYSWSAPVVSGGLTGGAAGILLLNINGTLNNPTNVPQSATYTVTPTTVNCGDATPFTLVVTVNPIANITSMTSVSCSGVTFNVTPVNGANGIVPLGTTYTWTAPTGTGFTGGATQIIPITNITGNLTNNTSSAVTATYVVTPNTGCGSSTSFTLVITLNPAATVNAMTTVICSGVTFNVTPVDGTNGIIPIGTTYTWTAPTGSGFTGGASQTIAVNTITGTLVNTTNTFKTVTYIVTPITVNCGAGTPFTLTVTLDPAATITPMTTTTCSGVTFSITPANATNGIIPAGTLYTWLAPTGTGITNGASQTTPVSNIFGTITNTTNTAKTATYLVTPISGSCTGAVFSVTATIDPVASITAMTATSCSGLPFTSTAANGTNGIVPAGTTYVWTAPTGTGFTGGLSHTVAASAVSGTLTNITSGAVSATYIVTPTSGSCTGTPYTLTVTVNPVATITAMSASICSGVTFNITPVDGTNGIIPAGTTYNWSAPVVTGGLTGGVTATGQLDINGNLSNPTNTAQSATYIVTPVTVNCGAGVPFTVGGNG